MQFAYAHWQPPCFYDHKTDKTSVLFHNPHTTSTWGHLHVKVLGTDRLIAGFLKATAALLRQECLIPNGYTGFWKLASYLLLFTAAHFQVTKDYRQQSLGKNLKRRVLLWIGPMSFHIKQTLIPLSKKKNTGKTVIFPERKKIHKRSHMTQVTHSFCSSCSLGPAN